MPARPRTQRSRAESRPGRSQPCRGARGRGGVRESAVFAFPAATAGDVNGDGFNDVIVGAPRLGNDVIAPPYIENSGQAYVYHGGISGIPHSATPDWVADPDDQDGQWFGHAVGTAGDVNGDGYSDVIVGAPSWADTANSTWAEGRALVYLGSATGLSTTPDWVVSPANASHRRFGHAVSTAGDVNGDGYSDVIVGSPGGLTGAAYVYFGSPGGLSSTPDWSLSGSSNYGAYGTSVSCAGDVNGDGYGDIIVGEPNSGDGNAYVYFGGPSGPSTTPDWSGTSTTTVPLFGFSVATAGDIDGDGYGDLIIGSSEDSVWVYHGSASGPSPGSFPDWTAVDPNGGQNIGAGTAFGWSVASAGDMNGDGYGDVIIGAPFKSDSGRAYVYRGSPLGLSANVGPAETYTAPVIHRIGNSVALAGDVDGDGWGDIILGGHRFNAQLPDEGTPYVMPGMAAGLPPTHDVEILAATTSPMASAAGDVNGDGYRDLIVATYRFSGQQQNEGRVAVHYGGQNGISATPNWAIDPTDQQYAGFGFTVASAGDVNGDGFDDILVGARGSYAKGQGAYLYFGSASGPSTTAWDWFVGPSSPTGNSWRFVASAGDVNGDGYADVLVASATSGVHCFHGGPNGPSTTPTVTLTSPISGVSFSYPFASAGDVNQDGYGDVVIGAPGYDDTANGLTDEGRIYVYLGGPTGLVNSPSSFSDPTDQGGARFGSSVSTAGDVNRDGYSDVIVAARHWNSVDYPDEGRAYVFLGGASGLAASPAWEADPRDAPGDKTWTPGFVAGAAGDVNGDGYSDVILGNECPPSGSAYVYHGSPSGLTPAATPDWSRTMAQGYAHAAGTAGDVNGDGFDDVFVTRDSGRVYVYYGNDGGGVARNPIQLRVGASTLVQLGGINRGPSVVGSQGIRLRLLTRTPAGRTRARMVSELKPLGTNIDFLGLVFGAWVDTDLVSAFGEVTQTRGGLAGGTPYHWRARFQYAPYMTYGVWFSPGPNGFNETDFRTRSSTGSADRHRPGR